MASKRKTVTLTFEASNLELENIVQLVEDSVGLGFKPETVESLRHAIYEIVSVDDWDEGEPGWMKK